MAYQDIQEFIKVLETKGMLKRITTEVDAQLEITEIVDRVCKKGGPALLFERVKNSDYPVLINAFGAYDRMSLALGVSNLEDIAQEIRTLIDPAHYVGIVNKIKEAPRLLQMAHIFPRRVNAAPCQQVVEEPDLDKLPILQCWPGDGGKFITLPLVVTKDPATGNHNMGMYRMQVYDKRTTGMHWHLHKDGRENFNSYKEESQQNTKMPVSVAIGADPAAIYAATAPLPKGISEYLFAGFLRKKPVQVVRCLTNDLEVPAHAEFILEGYVNLDETREEGPFGDHTGYYSLKDHYPVFHITCMTHKKEPVYPATVVGKPPMEDCFLAKATERIFLPLLQLQNPEIIDINMPLEGVFHNCVIISIKKSYPGHAKKIMNAVWGTGQMMFTKLVTVVDHTVDPHDLSTVAWKVFNNVDAKRDVLIVDGPLDALDHSSPLAHYGHKMGIDATRKWPEEGHLRQWPEDIEMNDEIKRLVDKKWPQYGI